MGVVVKRLFVLAQPAAAHGTGHAHGANGFCVPPAFLGHGMGGNGRLICPGRRPTREQFVGYREDEKNDCANDCEDAKPNMEKENHADVNGRPRSIEESGRSGACHELTDRIQVARRL